MSGVEAHLKGHIGGFHMDIAFTAPKRGVTALFGPSGCGKTTALRCIAGLTRLSHSRLSVFGEPWQQGATFLAPHRRPVGYVFQQANLFPHLSVRGNLLYGQKRARGTQDTSLENVVSMLGLETMLARDPANLSGGERQRVAIGRALLSQPRLLLMDEPLSALDRQSKNDILPYLETLHDRLAIPVLYVSHDLAEVERLADHVVMMERGTVCQEGPVAEVMTDLDLPQMRTAEAAAVLTAHVAGHEPEYGLCRMDVDGQNVYLPGLVGPMGSSRRLRVMAIHVSLSLQAYQDSSILNVWRAKVLRAEPAGPAGMMVLMRLGEDGSGQPVLSRITRKSWDRLNLKPGQTVWANAKTVALADG
ncbi:molybdenum ABC transporter ATP-binding protein [Magnetospira sp. QH-2]|uniref:molybdenum ABC transporter ATP-binding protein n=1 Tax=Magnetospira sp. (strain QH-2) TaxID=1288970 RepID=UPI0003E80E41|nr:molybdenum ABC transporter ATP-binding protein [Magnetospira sp. QH-2]CCQ75385.1 molybdenum ABC transporter ATP-binding protein [Magnetospira sp. QH-2]